MGSGWQVGIGAEKTSSASKNLRAIELTHVCKVMLFPVQHHTHFLPCQRVSPLLCVWPSIRALKLRALLFHIIFILLLVGLTICSAMLQNYVDVFDPTLTDDIRDVCWTSSISQRTPVSNLVLTNVRDQRTPLTNVIKRV